MKYWYFGGTIVLHFAVVLSAVLFGLVNSFWQLLVILFLPLCTGIILKLLKNDKDITWGILIGSCTSTVLIIVVFLVFLSSVRMC